MEDEGDEGAGRVAGEVGHVEIDHVDEGMVSQALDGFGGEIGAEVTGAEGGDAHKKAADEHDADDGEEDLELEFRVGVGAGLEGFEAGFPVLFELVFPADEEGWCHAGALVFLGGAGFFAVFWTDEIISASDLDEGIDEADGGGCEAGFQYHAGEEGYDDGGRAFEVGEKAAVCLPVAGASREFFAGRGWLR